MSHMTPTPLSRSKGQRSTCRWRCIFWRPPAHLAQYCVYIPCRAA